MKMFDISTIIAIISTLGGLEFVKWLFSRRSNTVDWMEKRLAERDKKIDTLYIELRTEQAKHQETIQKLHETEIALSLAKFFKCEKRGCEERIPPNKDL